MAMDTIFGLALAGFAIGTFGTLIGAGGGFILVPLLILTHSQMPPSVITAISMAVVALNALSGSVAYARSGRIDYKAGLLFGAFTIPGSVIGVFLVNYIPQHIFHIVFGIVLIALAVYLFAKRNTTETISTSPPSTPNTPVDTIPVHTITDKSGQTFQFPFHKTGGIIVSIVVGILSPLLGIGGGIIHVPAMVQWLQFPVYIATATSHFVLAIMSTVSVIVHIVQGSYNDPYVQKMLLSLCIGVVPGAQLGAYLSHRIQTKLIIQLLAVCLGLVGLRILL